MVIVSRLNSELLRDFDCSINMSAISFKVLTAISWIFTGLAILLTGGRYWIRYKIVKRLSWEDVAHLMGLLLLIAQVSIVSWAASFMYRNVNLEAGDAIQFEVDHLQFVRLNVATVLLTWCCLYAIKMSFLLLYYHIFQISKTFIRAWWTVLAIVILTFWISIAGSLTQCGSPLALEHIGTFSTFGYPLRFSIVRLTVTRELPRSVNDASTGCVCHLQLRSERLLGSR